MIPSAADKLTEDSVYEYYRDVILPSILLTLPMLLKKLAVDSYQAVKNSVNQLLDFVAPKWSTPRLPTPPLIVQKLLEQSAQQQATVTDFLLRHFDTNNDGHISRDEVVAMTEAMTRIPQQSFWQWIGREWPLMDWKLGVFLWRTFGGLLFLLAVLSIVPGKLHGLSARILRWPVLGMVYFLIAVELCVYVVIRLGIRLAETLVARPKHSRLRKKMKNAKSYQEWYLYAQALDRSQKRDLWLRRVDDETSRHYNWGFIKELVKDMRHARQERDSLHALAVMQQCTRKNVGGIMSEDLFSYSNTGEPKHLVREFVDEVTATLYWLTDEALKVANDGSTQRSNHEKVTYEQHMQSKLRDEKDKLWKSLLTVVDPNNRSGSSGEESSQNSQEKDQEESSSSLPSFHRDEVLTFLKRARAAYGRTALCLSGGAMMGLYHVGHVRGLLETGTLPHIISGTSAGSVVGALLCTRTTEELERDLVSEKLAQHMKCFSRPWTERIKSVMENGNMFSFEEWLDMIQWFTCGNMTFEEAFKKTGRVFCITLSSTTRKAPPVLINYLSAPNVTIASAVIASAAVPGFIPPVRLQYKDGDGTIRYQGNEREQTYFDGSIRQDIPVAGLAEMLNCQFFIACQCNPHVVPFFYNNKGAVGRPSRWSSGTQETSWRGGFLLSALEMYLKNDMKAKFVFLNEVEAAVGFTSTLLTQDFVGSTTIVPQVSFWDYFKLFSDPNLEDFHHYFQAGSVAAYEHVAMIKLHYSIADALDDCVARLERGTKGHTSIKRRSTFSSFDKVTSDVPSAQQETMSEIVDTSRGRNNSETLFPSTMSGNTAQTEDELDGYDSDEYANSWVDI